MVLTGSLKRPPCPSIPSVRFCKCKCATGFRTGLSFCRPPPSLQGRGEGLRCRIGLTEKRVLLRKPCPCCASVWSILASIALMPSCGVFPWSLSILQLFDADVVIPQQAGATGFKTGGPRGFCGIMANVQGTWQLNFAMLETSQQPAPEANDRGVR